MRLISLQFHRGSLAIFPYSWSFLQLPRCWQSWPDSQQLCSAITQLSLPQDPSAPRHYFCRKRCLKRPLLWLPSSTHSSPTPWTLTLGAGALKISSVKCQEREALSTSAFLQALSLNHLPQQVHVSIYIPTLQKLLWLPLNFVAHFNASWVLIFPTSFLCAQTMLLYSLLCNMSLLPLLHTDIMHT